MSIRDRMSCGTLVLGLRIENMVNGSYQKTDDPSDCQEQEQDPDAAHSFDVTISRCHLLHPKSDSVTGSRLFA
jgi:hypothetical protein